MPSQVARSLELTFLEVGVGHADAIQLFELLCTSRRQLFLLLTDDPVVGCLDRQVPRPVLQQTLVLGFVVLPLSGLDAICYSLVLWKGLPVGIFLPRLREEHHPQLVAPF